MISSITALQFGALVVSSVLLGIASLSDIATRTIPNSVSLGLLTIGVGVSLVGGNALMALIASTTVFLFGALCWRCGCLGGGDVKLLAACSWLVSPALVPELVLLTAIAGGILASLYLVLSCVARASRTPALSCRPRSLAGRIWRAERWRIRRRAALPYGCAIAVATLLTLSGW
jgi:prepilin peptidase CpaA